MPRQRRFSSGPRGSPTAMRPAASAAPPSPQPSGATPQQPSLFKQMAATAAGVAVGSAVGHSIGSALTGGSSQPETVSAQQQPDEVSTAVPAANPCQHYIDDLIRCSYVNGDISQCQYVANALKECRRMYNLQ
ncbi:Coiled-coil-helix-coiled-coil-helix domain-containing protein 10, mitochondrial [Echinococcus granulosus]|uniref:Coiled coil helix coiled coil helix n=2 Tax=Echinococcus granulosus TaxID=6210 RepID=A0A068WPA6_ECHGR|nr:Coiled-coil-helix-coiled-coil-helix domain-containing protein 10, mitochondrial [Echinococcus granulosus]CDS20274.1 coiled coil helix coiled coil helix [Echinococcus granulosus]